MAQVPYVPYSTATPISPGEGVREDTPEAAFGVNIGRAVEHLGTTTEEVGNELYQRATALQELQNETMAREQAVKTTQGMAERYEQFKMLGDRMSEPGQLQSFYKDIEQMRQDGRSTLPNAHAQKMFDSEAASLQNRVTMASAASAGDAFKSRAIGQATAQMVQATKQWVDPRDEKEVRSKIDQMRQGVDTIAGVKGLTDPERNAAYLTETSKIRKSQIEAIAITDSQRALTMLDDRKMKGQLTQNDYDSAYKFSIGQNRIVGAEFLSKQVYGDGTKSYKDAVEEIKELAPKYAHKDEMFEKAALNALENKYIVGKRIETQQYNTARQDVEEAMNSGRFKTVQEMQANPGLAVSISSMREGDQAALQGRLNKFWKDKDYVGNKEEYDRLWGMSGNPATQQQFLNEDLWKAKIDDGQRGKLLMIRKGLLKGQPAMDPQVQKAAAAIRRIYPHSLPSDTRSDAYLTFLGSLQGAMEDLSAAKGAKLGQEDYEKLGKALVQEIPKSGWFNNYKVFEEPVPSERVERYKAQGLTNDDEITYQYHRERAMQSYQELFGGGTFKK